MKTGIIKATLSLTILVVLLLTCKELEKEILITTGEISNLQTNSADAAGTLVDLGEGVIQHGHYYSKSSDPTKDILKTSLGQPEGTGGFISQVTGLEAGTKYYIVAYATGSKGSSFGEIKSFTTLPASLPALTTSDVTSVTLTSASTGGTISADGGAPVTARGVCWGTAANPTVEGSKTTDGSGTGSFTSTISGLNPGTVYYARAYATNSAGTGYGEEKTFTTTAASLPILTTVPVTEITETTAKSGGDITNDGGMPVTARGVCWNTTGSPVIADNKTVDDSGAGLFASSITGLAQGTKYYIRAYATGSVGTAYGNELNFTTVTLLVPGAPVIGTVTAGNSQVTVAFTPPSNDGGSAITGYTVTSDPGNKTSTGLSSPIIVTGLVNGTAYTFTVTATNTIGTGPTSASSNPVTPSTVPGAPVIGTATAGNAHVSVTFTAPASDGGSAITGYTVTSNPGNKTGTGTSSPVTVTGLANGTAYTFTVTATNTNGTGAPSAASNSVMPLASFTVPGAPTGVSAVKGDAQATVTFTAPASDGGSTITGYTVTSSPGGFTGTGTASPITVTGLVNGIVYTFTVTATNTIGTGPASSASNSVTPSSSITSPGAPTGVSAVGGYEKATISFTPPINNGGSAITGYTVTSSPGGFTGTGSVSPIIVTGLPALIAYTFTVTATNSAGTGPASSASNSVTPTTVPGAPTIGTATSGYAQSIISFTAPVSDGGSAITGYTVTSNPGGYTGNGSGSPITVTGLPALVAYTFTVTATNANGTGSASSPSNSATPTTLPGAPTNVTATKENTQATVTFTAPSSDGGSAITGYTVTSSPSGKTGTGTTTTITVTGLTNGTAYTFTVTATNINGTGPASSTSNSVTPSTVPGIPIIGTAIKGDALATVAFTAPTSDGGSAITGYTVTSNPGGKTGTGTASPITVTGLTNGTAYTFTVTATNINGPGSASIASNSVIPSIPPGAPTIGTATKGNAQATVTFTAPASDGGAAITGYTATSNPGAKTGTATASPITVIGLSNGTAYTFTVTATNINGTGPASSASNSVTPSTVPGTPTIGTATAGDTQASVTFTPPANNGGSAITGYTVTSNPGGKTGTGTTTTITVTGLTNLTAYTFIVVATNVNGNSVSSTASNSVIPGTVTNPSTGKIWMDRNLGANQVATSSTDAASYGDLYQWGRGADGHQIRTSSTTTTLSSSDNCGHGNFILTSVSPYSWRNPLNPNLWQGVSGVNNPCPTGYRLPTKAEWDAEYLSWSSNNAAGAFASPLKLTVAGNRQYTIYSNGNLYDVGSAGWYWSSSFNGSYSYILSFGSGGVSTDYPQPLANGFSVRCLKD